MRFIGNCEYLWLIWSYDLSNGKKIRHAPITRIPYLNWNLLVRNHIHRVSVYGWHQNPFGEAIICSMLTLYSLWNKFSILKKIKLYLLLHTIDQDVTYRRKNIEIELIWFGKWCSLWHWKLKNDVKVSLNWSHRINTGSFSYRLTNRQPNEEHLLESILANPNDMGSNRKEVACNNPWRWKMIDLLDICLIAVTMFHILLYHYQVNTERQENEKTNNNNNNNSDKSLRATSSITYVKRQRLHDHNKMYRFRYIFSLLILITAHFTLFRHISFYIQLFYGMISLFVGTHLSPTIVGKAYLPENYCENFLSREKFRAFLFLFVLRTVANTICLIRASANERLCMLLYVVFHIIFNNNNTNNYIQDS